MLLAGMAARPPRPRLALSGTAAAAECTWKKHSKRVVKRCNGTARCAGWCAGKHWWTCEPVAAAPAPPSPPPRRPAAPEPEPEPEANRVAARASEYYWILSRPKVKAGTVTVELNNQGEDPHNLNLQREGGAGEPLQIPEAASLQRSVASFDLRRANTGSGAPSPNTRKKGCHHLDGGIGASPRTS